MLYIEMMCYNVIKSFKCFFVVPCGNIFSLSPFMFSTQLYKIHFVASIIAKGIFNCINLHSSLILI